MRAPRPLSAIFCACMTVLVLAAPAFAEEEEKFPPARSAVVTSVQKCLDQLDPADAAHIRASYVQPYQECQKRLAKKLDDKKKAEAKAVSETPAPVTPRNFVRVKKAEEKPAEPAPDAKEPTPEKPSVKAKGFYRDR